MQLCDIWHRQPSLRWIIMRQASRSRSRPIATSICTSFTRKELHLCLMRQNLENASALSHRNMAGFCRFLGAECQLPVARQSSTLYRWETSRNDLVMDASLHSWGSQLRGSGFAMVFVCSSCCGVGIHPQFTIFTQTLQHHVLKDQVIFQASTPSKRFEPLPLWARLQALQPMMFRLAGLQHIRQADGR